MRSVRQYETRTLRLAAHVKCAAKRQTGFTLIELLAAALLTVMLMAAVFRVLSTSFADTRQLKQHRTQFPSVALLKEQIRRDIQNAQGLQAGPNVLQLYGYMATDAQSRMPTMTRAFVTYSLRRADDHQVLLREESAVGGVGRQSSRRDVLWHGVGQFDVLALADMDDDDGGIGAEIPPDTGGLPEVPPVVKIALLNESQQLLLRETIRHHREL